MLESSANAKNCLKVALKILMQLNCHARHSFFVANIS